MFYHVYSKAVAMPDDLRRFVGDEFKLGTASHTSLELITSEYSKLNLGLGIVTTPFVRGTDWNFLPYNEGFTQTWIPV